MEKERHGAREQRDRHEKEKSRKRSDEHRERNRDKERDRGRSEERENRHENEKHHGRDSRHSRDLEDESHRESRKRAERGEKSHRSSRHERRQKDEDRETKRDGHRREAVRNGELLDRGESLEPVEKVEKSSRDRVVSRSAKDEEPGSRSQADRYNSRSSMDREHSLDSDIEGLSEHSADHRIKKDDDPPRVSSKQRERYSHDRIGDSVDHEQLVEIGQDELEEPRGKLKQSEREDGKSRRKHDTEEDNDGSVERQTRKRKEHGNEQNTEKRSKRTAEDERDRVPSETLLNGNEERRKGRDRKRKFEESAEGDMHHNEEKKDFEESNTNGSLLNGGDSTNGVVVEPPLLASRPLPESFVSHSSASKVSSVSITHENMGNSITRSHEVPGKSSTDGPSSTVGKSSNLSSLGALAKAKKALQIQKELSEKLKKLPQLNKTAGTNSTTASQAAATTTAPSDEASTLSASVQSSTSFPKMATAAATPTQASAGTSTIPAPVTAGMPSLLGLPDLPKLEAVRRAQELAAKLGFRQDPSFAPILNLFPGQVMPDLTTAPQKPSKAPVLRLDTQGREIDEHGNVIDISKPTNLSTLKVNINKQKKDAFQILHPELDVDADSNPFFDDRMGINKAKLLRPKRMTFQFVEEGKWSKEAEIIKFKSQFGEAQAKEIKTKQAQLAKAKAEVDINPNLIEVSQRVPMKEEKPRDPIPDVEWWDVPVLPSGSYDAEEVKLKMEKLTIYVEHPLPVEPPAEPAPPPPQPLKLTKKEQKKLRTQRRLAKEKDRQEMIRQGLLEPPKPKVKMSNLMRVLGAEATQDPTKLEMEIRAAAAEREQAHVDRNIARKLTPAERREKKERKLFDDPNTPETIVSLYKIKDLSHPQTRFKVDVNAQENRLTGCSVISDEFSVVVVEGGSKSIKRYSKLMLHRINWAAAVADEEENEGSADTPPNKCMLVWQGSVAKASFNKFLFHQCRTEAAARKIFSDVGVGHYWDLAANFSDDQI